MADLPSLASLAVHGARRRVVTPPNTFYRHLVQSLTNGVLAVTTNGRIAFVSRGAHDVLGIEVCDDLVNRRFDEALSAHPEVVALLNGALRHELVTARAQLRLTDSGKVVGYTLSLVRDEDGRLEGAALVFKDLTELERLEERERLRDRLVTLGEMAAAIAHEVKNPLGGIEVMAGLLKRRLKQVPDAVALLNDIIHEAKMANATVVDVLDFARPMRLQVHPVDLRALVADAVQLAQRTVPRDNIAVHRHVDADVPGIEADGYHLRQLLVNLVTNAFEALEPQARHAPKTVEIRVRRATDGEGRLHHLAPVGDGAAAGVVLEVGDDGPGVAMEIRDRIYSPFFSTKPKGTGLGLANVKKVADAHGGSLTLESPASGGAVFRVVLPVTSAGERASDDDHAATWPAPVNAS